MQALALTSGLYNGLFLTPALMALGKHLPRTDLRSTLMKLAIASFFFQPIVYVPYFFVFHGLMTGEAFSACVADLSTGYFSTLSRMWMLYMPTRLIMFAIVPIRYQVVWECCVSFAWQFILSLFNASRQQAIVSGIIATTAQLSSFGEASQPRLGIH